MNRRFSILLLAVTVLGLGTGAGTGYLQRQVAASGVKSTSSTASAPNSTSAANSSNAASSSTPSAQQSQNARPSGGQSQPGGNQSGRQQGGGFGTVADANASGFSLASQGGAVQVVTSTSSKITKIADVKVSDLKVGDEVVAIGSQQGDGSLLATSIQVGATGGLPGIGAFPTGGTGQFGQGGQGNQAGQNQRNGSNSQAQPQASPRAAALTVTGTITAIDGNTVTVKTQAGSLSKVNVGNDTTIRKTVDGTLSDIANGQTAIVSGDRNDAGAIVATSIQLVPATMMTTGR